MAGEPLFPASHASRVGRAREQFFGQGLRPTGMVPEPVIQSWMRCLQQGRGAADHIAFEPVTRSRVHATLRRHDGLLQAAAPSIEKLEAALGGTGCRLLLTSGDGIVIHAGHAHAPAEGTPVLSAAARVGVNLSERAVGTNAPALVVATGCAVAVNSAEHFHAAIHGVSCAAAPIHDSRRALIRQALAAHGGNIARTARAMKVSRGLVYRALRGDA